MAITLDAREARSLDISVPDPNAEHYSTLLYMAVKEIGVLHTSSLGLLPDVPAGTRNVNRFRLVEGDPLSASVACEREERVGRGEWAVRVLAECRMTADERDFLVVDRLVAHEGAGAAEREVFTRTWTRSIPRDQV